MTFDNRVNVCLDGETEGTLQHEEPELSIACLVNGQWTVPSGTNETPPVAGATTFVGTPLSTFLSAEAAKGVSLDSLVGDWGVDGSLVPSTQATYRSWEIVRGSGIFAVVPEPSTLALCLAAVAALGCGCCAAAEKSCLRSRPYLPRGTPTRIRGQQMPQDIF